MICYDYTACVFLTAPNSGTSCFIFWGSPASTRKKVTHSFKSYLIRKQTKLNCQSKFSKHIFGDTVMLLGFFKPCPPKQKVNKQLVLFVGMVSLERSTIDSSIGFFQWKIPFAFLGQGSLEAMVTYEEISIDFGKFRKNKPRFGCK